MNFIEWIVDALRGVKNEDIEAINFSPVRDGEEVIGQIKDLATKQMVALHRSWSEKMKELGALLAKTGDDKWQVESLILQLKDNLDIVESMLWASVRHELRPQINVFLGNHKNDARIYDSLGLAEDWLVVAVPPYPPPGKLRIREVVVIVPPGGFDDGTPCQCPGCVARREKLEKGGV